jgi:ABC-type enterochelin transport system ATPase subunit
MPTIVSLLSANEKAMQEFHDMRAKDQEHLTQIKAFIKQEHDILSKIIKDLRLFGRCSKQEFRSNTQTPFNID